MNKKEKYILLILALIGISIGYAVLSSNLLINGSSTIKNANWDIHFENIQETTGSIIPNNETTINALGNAISYEITLNKPGDFYEFTVDVVNDGTIDGMISETHNILNGNPITELPPYLDYSFVYSDGTSIAVNQLLLAGEFKTYKIRVEFKKDINANDMPSTPQTLSFTNSVTYVQANNTELEAGPNGIIYTANPRDLNVTGYNSVWYNQEYPEGIPYFNTPADALAALAVEFGRDVPFYLKHNVENGIVTESYVEFIVSEELAAENPGMVPGTYTLRGEKTYERGSGWIVDNNYISPYYENNKEIIKTAFGYSSNPSRCYTSGTAPDSYAYNCNISNLYAQVSSRGHIFVGDNINDGCCVNKNGYSNC